MRRCNVRAPFVQDASALEAMLCEREDEVGQLKKKGEANASRIKILEADNQGLRKKIQALLTKTSASRLLALWVGCHSFYDAMRQAAPVDRKLSPALDPPHPCHF